MAKRTSGIYQTNAGTWDIDKSKFKVRIRRCGFQTHAEAERWLTKELSRLSETLLHKLRVEHRFGDAAAKYVEAHGHKISLETDINLLKSVMPFISSLTLSQVHDESLKPFVNARLAEGRSHKTINLTLAIVRRILNLCATAWRDENGLTWLAAAPKVTMLPLIGHQREPRPITWAQQNRLLKYLPDHLRRMAHFVLNTGVRDNVVCNLRWDWEIPVQALNISIFVVPRRFVKGRKAERVIVCSSEAQKVVEAARGKHPEFVFVYRRERVKNLDQAAQMPYRPIQMMNNTAWQNGRKLAGLGDLHVHDLRHTVGMRLREAGVNDSTIADVLWHSKPSMTHHYTVAQIQELFQALEKIKEDTGVWNMTISTLRTEHLDRIQNPIYRKSTVPIRTQK